MRIYEYHYICFSYLWASLLQKSVANLILRYTKKFFLIYKEFLMQNHFAFQEYL